MKSKGKVIDMAGVRRGMAHLDRAEKLSPDVKMRPVPIAEIVGAGQLAYTVAQVAAIVGQHPCTIRAAIRDGKLQAASAGGKGHYRISRPDLEAWWRFRGGGTLFGDAEQ